MLSGKYVLRVIGALLLLGSPAQAQQESRSGDQTGPLPGPLHRQVGTWSVQGDLPAAEGASPTSGTRICEWMGDGRVLLCRFVNSTQSYAGMAVTSYDATSHATSGYWMGAADTHGPIRITGRFDPETATLTERGEKPVAGGKTVVLEYIWTFPADDEMRLKVYVRGADGDRQLVVSDRITRRRAP